MLTGQALARIEADKQAVLIKSLLAELVIDPNQIGSVTVPGLRPQNRDEAVHCAVASIGGQLIFYGRGTLSGDWYIDVTAGARADRCATKQKTLIKGALREAFLEGEDIMWHPYGPAMLRLDWMGSSSGYPQDKEKIKEFKRVLEQMPPQSRS